MLILGKRKTSCSMAVSTRRDKDFHVDQLQQADQTLVLSVRYLRAVGARGLVRQRNLASGFGQMSFDSFASRRCGFSNNAWRIGFQPATTMVTSEAIGERKISISGKPEDAAGKSGDVDACTVG